MVHTSWTRQRTKISILRRVDACWVGPFLCLLVCATALKDEWDGLWKEPRTNNTGSFCPLLAFCKIVCETLPRHYHIQVWLSLSFDLKLCCSCWTTAGVAIFSFHSSTVSSFILQSIFKYALEIPEVPRVHCRYRNIPGLIFHPAKI